MACIPKHDTHHENPSILRSVRRYSSTLPAGQNEKAELPKVFPSAARPSSLKTRRFPTLLAKGLALSGNNFQVYLVI